MKRFHSSLFSEIYEGNIEITNEVSTELEYNLKKINTSIRNFQNIENNQSSLKAEQELGSIREYTDALGKLFNLNNLPRFNSNDRTTDEVKYVVTIDKYVKELVKLFKFINTSCNFSHNYKTAPLLYDGLTELVLLPVGNGSLSFGLHGYSNETLKREKLNLGIMLRRVAENK